MLFVDDMVSIDEIRKEINDRLKVQRHTLKAKEFKLSKTKMEYLKCKNSVRHYMRKAWKCSQTQALPKSDNFKYLDSIIQGGRNIDGDVTCRIGATWMKLRFASGVLCNKKILVET